MNARGKSLTHILHDFFNGPLACAAIALTVASGCQEHSSPAAPALSSLPGSAPSDKPAAQGPDARGKVRDITFDNIKFDMEKEEPFEPLMLTETIKKLIGQKIRIRGYILPTLVQNGITEFVLVRDNMECCFGPGAALYDCILVKMTPGTSTDYVYRPVTVEGVFTIKELRGPGGKHLAIYQMQGQTVQ